MKLIIGLLLGFSIGALCYLFAIPVPAPPVIQGALLVVAMTVGYWAVDRVMTKPAMSNGACGGPDGQSKSQLEQ